MPGDRANELHVLRLAAGFRLSGEDAANLRTIAVRDWTHLVEGAAYHRVAPLVRQSLMEVCRSTVSPGALDQLHRHNATQAARSLSQVVEIDRLSRLFAESGIQFLVLKGVALSMQLHGDPGLRGVGDIDLLVAPKDFWKAAALLNAAGYGSAFGDLSAGQRESYRRWFKELKFVHAASGDMVELHHRLTANPYLLPIEFEMLWRERAQVRVGDVSIDTLAMSRLPLYLCIHGAGHCWERLRWLVDFALVLPNEASIAMALADADAAGLRPPMLHSLELAHRLLGLPVPEHIVREARQNRQARRLASINNRFSAGPNWTSRPAAASWEWMRRYSLWLRLYNLSLKADWIYRMHQLRADWIVPDDWAYLDLPDRLRWAYPLIRPLMWVARRWRPRRTAAKLR